MKGFARQTSGAREYPENEDGIHMFLVLTFMFV